MNFAYSQPDRVMVGTRGEVGARLFLFQVREGRRLSVVKCEKSQLAALGEWMAHAVSALPRPGHLPEDLTLEPEYEVDFVVGDIAVVLDEDGPALEVTMTSLDEESTLSVRLTREWAGALAIAITRLVEAGRPLCPLCAGPLEENGHDCPRTNGHRAPAR